jgi:hypothetical protein
MLIVAIFLIGLVLGLRFKFLILVPAIGLTLAMVAFHGNVDGVWWLVGKMVVAAIFLQLGYVGGSILRFGISASRAADHGRASIPTSTEVPSSELRNRAGASSRFEASKQLRQA